MAVLTQGEVDHDVRATVWFLSKVDFFPSFRSWFKGSKEGFDPHSEVLETIESQFEEYTFRFRLGRECQ